MIVHDLRSPLTGILSSLQLIQMMAGDRLEKEEMEDVDRALQATRQLVDMVSALLDVNRMESGEMPLNLAAMLIPAVKSFMSLNWPDILVPTQMWNRLTLSPD
jgi:K+-sensing histidine kinase KdpD